MMIYYSSTFVYRNQTDSKRQITGPHFISYACSFERTTPFINFLLVISENHAIGNITPRTETIRYRYQPTSTPITGKRIHIGHIGKLQESLASEPFNWMISHSVGYDYQMFHSKFRL